MIKIVLADANPLPRLDRHLLGFRGSKELGDDVGLHQLSGLAQSRDSLDGVKHVSLEEGFNVYNSGVLLDRES